MIDTSSLDPATRSESGRSSGHRLLVPIVVGIVCGTAVGGLVPALGVRTAILGEIFLNLLMMLVVPLVLLSMIVGITGLGDIRNLGSLGWRTILY